MACTLFYVVRPSLRAIARARIRRTARALQSEARRAMRLASSAIARAFGIRVLVNWEGRWFAHAAWTRRDALAWASCYPSCAIVEATDRRPFARQRIAFARWED